MAPAKRCRHKVFHETSYEAPLKKGQTQLALSLYVVPPLCKVHTMPEEQQPFYIIMGRSTEL